MDFCVAWREIIFVKCQVNLISKIKNNFFFLRVSEVGVYCNFCDIISLMRSVKLIVKKIVF